jgi:hypothetical protein
MPAPLKWVTRLLSQITSQQMEVVTFHIRLEYRDALAIVDLTCLAQIFARAQFVGLHRIVFVLTGHRMKSTIFIKEKLLTWDSRGILHFVGQ